MLRFMDDFEQVKNTRHMELTLMFLATFESFFNGFAFYTMDTLGLYNNQIDKTVYLLHMMIQAINVPLIIAMPTRHYAFARTLFRIGHMMEIYFVFYMSGAIMIPPYIVGYYCLEWVYLVHGVIYNQMEFPGKWLSRMIDSKDEEEPAVRTHPFTSIINEVIRKDCTINEEFEDDIFDYHTCLEEDDILYERPSPIRGTFIV